jgi:hypothetical protein
MNKKYLQKRLQDKALQKKLEARPYMSEKSKQRFQIFKE